MGYSGVVNFPESGGRSWLDWRVWKCLRRIEIAILHVTNRTVRRCFLLGDDPVTGKNFDHRKRWLDEQLIHQARHFGIDLLCQAILSNHFHLVLRSRPDVVDNGMTRKSLADG